MDNSISSIKNKSFEHLRSKSNPNLLQVKNYGDHSPNLPPMTKNFNHRKSIEYSNIPKYIEMAESKPIIFDDYKKFMKEMMMGYKLESDVEKKEKMKIFRENSEDSRTIKDYMKRFNNHNNSSILSDVRINVDSEEYTDPIESLNILENNRLIYEKINQLNSRRQTSLYKKIIKTVVNKPIVDFNKIKITNCPPKNSLVISSEGKNKYTIINSSNSIEFYSYYIYPKSNFPESREQFSICESSYGLIMYGGLSSKSFNDIWVLDPVKIEWKKITYSNSSPNPRFGHTAIFYQRRIILFGGRTKLNNYSFNADIEYFNIDDKTWEIPIISTKNHLRTRRNHIAELVNNQILVHGGLSEENMILNDFHLLNINPLKWYPVAISENSLIPALYGHSSTLVFPIDVRSNPKMTIYKVPEEKFQRKYQGRIREKGIYLFGGKSSDNVLSNDIYVVKLGRKPLDIFKLAVKGKPPCPRYFHTTNFYEEGNSLIVYGGRNDDHNEYALGDIFLFELASLEWIEVSIYSNINITLYARCGHSSLIVNNKLIVFGGMNNNNYLGSSLLFMELDTFPGKKESIMKRNMLEIILNENKKQKRKDKKKNIKMINYSCHLPPIK